MDRQLACDRDTVAVICFVHAANEVSICGTCHEQRSSIRTSGWPLSMGWTRSAPSSTKWYGQTSSMSSRLVTTSPARAMSAARIALARLPSGGCRRCRLRRRLRQPLAIQPGIRPLVRHAARTGRRASAQASHVRCWLHVAGQRLRGRDPHRDPAAAFLKLQLRVKVADAAQILEAQSDINHC